MANANFNSPLTLRLVTSEPNNGGTDYDVTLSSSVMNISADWRAASTPVWTALAAKTSLVGVHWVMYIEDVGYSTPTQHLYPYSLNVRGKISGMAGVGEIALGRQFFSDLITTDIARLVILATPVV